MRAPPIIDPGGVPVVQAGVVGERQLRLPLLLRLALPASDSLSPDAISRVRTLAGGRG
jgi:hypothetical protein